MRKDKLTEMLDYEPGREMRIQILKEVKETGKCIQEVASQYTLGTMAVLDDDCKFNYKGEMITPSEWRKINPLGPYGKIVIIGTKKDLDKLHELEKNESQQENINTNK